MPAPRTLSAQLLALQALLLADAKAGPPLPAPDARTLANAEQLVLAAATALLSGDHGFVQTPGRCVALSAKARQAIDALKAALWTAAAALPPSKGSDAAPQGFTGGNGLVVTPRGTMGVRTEAHVVAGALWIARTPMARQAVTRWSPLAPALSASATRGATTKAAAAAAPASPASRRPRPAPARRKPRG